MDIIKASGEKEKFKKEKLFQSLKQSGVQTELAEKVAGKVTKSIRPGMNSEKILREVNRHLQKEKPILAARYNLKRAVMELGPAGFTFEKYIAKILKEYGFAVKVGEKIRGYCISHEVDIIAQKEKNLFMVECKYHNSRGIKSDSKVALYTFARFLDLKKAQEKIKNKIYFFNQAWLVTNTRCTSQAIRYSRCVGLKIISWNYPRFKSLKYLIEKKGLYPITILPSLTRFYRERLTQKNLILTKDLLKHSVYSLSRLLGLKQNIAKKLQTEAKQLCLY